MHPGRVRSTMDLFYFEKSANLKHPNVHIYIIKQVRDRNSAYGDVTGHSAKITDNNPDYYYENWRRKNILQNIERILNTFDILWNFCIWYLVQPAKWLKGKIWFLQFTDHKLVTWGIFQFPFPSNLCIGRGLQKYLGVYISTKSTNCSKKIDGPNVTVQK